MTSQPVEQHDGNVIRAGIKVKNDLTQKFLGPNGYFTKLFTIIDVHLLVLIIGLQSSLLNYYILKYNNMDYIYYALFVIDLFTIITMIWSILTAKKYFELQDRIENPEYYANGFDCNPNNNFAQQALFCKLPQKLGVLPFIYICWLIYTISLISKILILFITNVPNRMLSDGFKYGPQTLEIGFALTSIIFLIFMYAHRNSENDYHRKLTESWIDDMISHTVFEIFDSIIFFDLVMPHKDRHESEIKHEIRETISPVLEYIIIGLASANFLIPTINLYHLSQLSACKGNACKKIDLKGQFRHIIIHLIRLFSVNIAYLVIRVYVSQSTDKAITIFIIKNVLCIIMSFRSLVIEVHEYLKAKRSLAQSGSQNDLKKNGSSAISKNNRSYEMQNFANHAGSVLVSNDSKSALVDKNQMPSGDNFEEVSLK